MIPVDNILFASEMIGAVRGIDPETGFHYDDTKRYIDATPMLDADARHKIYEGNARRVYPRLDRALTEQGTLNMTQTSTLQELGIVQRKITRADPAAVEQLCALRRLHRARGAWAGSA